MSETGPEEATQPAPADEPDCDPLEADLDGQILSVVQTWPQIDPTVESIVTRIAKADRYLVAASRRSLAKVGLSKEEFKVLMTLHDGPRAHGALCRELVVSTGAMTNRLDKLEHAGLVARSRDPQDRRGVLLELTAEGKAKLDSYIETGSSREKVLLEGLSSAEKTQLNQLLHKLVASIEDRRD
jgi:DNA-binding MarR family transcriptional regulator